MVEASWAIVQPILDVWKALPPRDFPNYASGSWGPEQAHEMLRRDGREWRDSGRSQTLSHAASQTTGAGKQ
jgi:glucose-6-phosphate 1-dehydrogenase